MYPALEVRLFLSASLSAASASMPMTISIHHHIQSQHRQRQFSVFDDTWSRPHRPQKEDEEAPEAEEDIFDFSGTSNSSPASEAEEQDDLESVYTDALSRKESLVSKKTKSFCSQFSSWDECMSVCLNLSIQYCIRIHISL